jgi:hypothetical protein
VRDKNYRGNSRANYDSRDPEPRLASAPVATGVLEKTLSLVRLATDPGASEQEQRTAAVAACRLIREHQLLAPEVPLKTIVNGWAKNWQKEYGLSEMASRCGVCIHCKGQFVPYDWVRPTFMGYIHSDCLKAWVKA